MDGGSDGIPLASTTPWCQLYIDPKNYDKPPKGSYPIVGPTYLMFYGQNNGVHVIDKIALIQFLMSRKPISSSDTWNMRLYHPHCRRQ